MKVNFSLRNRKILNVYNKDFLSLFIFENEGDFKNRVKVKVLVWVVEKFVVFGKVEYWFEGLCFIGVMDIALGFGVVGVFINLFWLWNKLFEVGII